MTSTSRFASRALLVLTTCTVAVVVAPACSSQVQSAALTDYQADNGGDVGLAALLLEDFGGLSTASLKTFAAPWKVSSTALLLWRGEKEGVSFDEAGVDKLLLAYGRFKPARVANWTGKGPAPTFERPLGVVTGLLHPAPGLDVEVENNGCATCHVGPGYKPDGTPDLTEAWIGVPNSSLDYDQYARDLFAALGAFAKKSDDDIVADVKRAFPDTKDSEVRAIRVVVLPRLREILKKNASYHSFAAYPGGLPGLTNGVATLKQMLHMKDDGAGETAFISIPVLQYRALKSSLLWDGIYAAPGAEHYRKMTWADVDKKQLDEVGAIPAVFTSGTLGIPPEMGEKNVDKIRAVFRATSGRSAPPLPGYPGAVDEQKAQAGALLFERRCAGCHGTYDTSTKPATLTSFPNKLVAQEAIGTDPMRWQRAEDEMIKVYNASAFGHFTNATRGEGYVAPILSGTWVSAPYFHNGSVPTVYAVLHPEARPARFLLGGHELDMQKVGVALDDADPTKFPAGYTPWSRPQIVDTSLPGLSNKGHERMLVNLSDADKDDLLEYLKLL